MSDVYVLAVDGFFPRLQSLRIYVHKCVIKTVSTGLPAIANLHMPNLETFDLYLKKRGETNEGEEQVKWATVEILTSHSVMPRLRRYSLIYSLLTSVEIRHIFQSSLFNNDNRHIRVQFALYINLSTSTDSSDITNICDIHSTCYNNIFVQYNDEDKSKLHYTWFTSSWPSWTIFWMNHHNVAPRSGVHQLGIKSPNISLHSLGKLCFDANELVFLHPASLSMVDSSLMAQAPPLINLRYLIIHNVVPGLELLFDGNMLPRLHSLRGLAVPLFVAFARRTNQMKTLDTVDHLVITDQSDNEASLTSTKSKIIVSVVTIIANVRACATAKVLASLILWTHSSKFDYNKLHASNNDSPEIDQLTNAVSDDDINVEESYSYVDIKSQESSSNIDNKLEKSYSNVVEKQRD
ncbi:unnamed protein product, partial [Rotaria sp. Silwood2]